MELLMNVMVASRISLFVIELYALLPYNNMAVRWLSGRTDISLLRMPEMVVNRVALWTLNLGHRARKCSDVSSPVSQRHRGMGQFRKP